MPISNLEKKLPKHRMKRDSTVESPFGKFMREAKEQEIKDLQDKKEKEILALEEKKKNEDIIRIYLDKLQKQLRDKKLTVFHTFPDKPGFKKYTGGEAFVENFVAKDPAKYANQKIAVFNILFHQNKEDSINRSVGNWLTVAMNVFCPNEKGKMRHREYIVHSANYVWRIQDFKITRFTFKLIEAIMHPVVNKKADYTSFSGLFLSFVISDLEKRGFKMKEFLNPLAGITQTFVEDK
jgi:hypothetical protein